MASRRPAGTRSEMIHCEFCGEDYAATYKRCPFCDGRPLDEEESFGEEASMGGGKRLATNARGGGYGGGPSPLRIVGTVLSLALIVAAVCIVISIIKPMIDKGKTPPVDPDVPPTPPQSQAVQPSQVPATSGPEASPAPTIPAGQTATGFTLNKPEGFTMSDRYPDPVLLKAVFIPAGSTGSITWSSSDPDVASVDESGMVSPGGKTGTATITATMGDGQTQSCDVINRVSSAAGSGETGAGAATGALSLNKTDFTFSSLTDPSVQMKVNGTSSTPAWSIGNTAVATISADGVVKPVGHGTTTVVCKVDGQELKCIVRCNF